MNKLLFDYFKKKKSLGVIAVGVTALVSVEVQAQSTPHQDTLAYVMTHINNSAVQDNTTADTGRIKYEFVNTQNTYVFVPHNSLSHVTMEAVGGGGVGGRADKYSLPFDFYGGGGGGGAYSRSFVDINPVKRYDVLVGVGGSYAANGQGQVNINGGISRVQELTGVGNTSVVDRTLVAARGGYGAVDASGGAGGDVVTSISVNDQNASYSIGYPNPVLKEGGKGQNVVYFGASNSGAGGGAAGSIDPTGMGMGSVGKDANGITGGGITLNYGGNGADGVVLPDGSQVVVGKSPTYGQGEELYGGGGSGGGRATNVGADAPGGDGAPGVVIMTYSPINKVEGACGDLVTIEGKNFTGSTEMPIKIKFKSYNDLGAGADTYVQLTPYAGSLNPPTLDDLADGEFYVIDSETIIANLPFHTGIIYLFTEYGRSKFYHMGQPTAPESITADDGNYVICHLDAIPLTVNGGVTVAGTQFQWYVGSTSQTPDEIIAAANNPFQTTTTAEFNYMPVHDDLVQDTQRIVVRKVLSGNNCNVITDAVYVDFTYTLRKFTGSSNALVDKWQEAGNWAPKMVPTLANCVYVTEGRQAVLYTGNGISNEGGFAKTLTVQTGGKLTLSSGANLIVKEEIKHIDDQSNPVNAHNFYVSEGANLIQLNETNSIFEGSLVVERISKKVTKYDHTYWASPVQTAFQNILWHKNGDLNQPDVFDVDVKDEMETALPWNPTGGSQGGGTWYHVGLNNNPDMVETARGYMIFPPVSFGPDLNGTAGFEPHSLRAQFVGTPHNKEYTATAYKGKKVLMGNPYPSSVGIDALLRRSRYVSGVNNSAAPSKITIRVWDKGLVTGDDGGDNVGFEYESKFVTATLAGPDTPDFVRIPSAQGFFVENFDGDGDITMRFANSVRYKGNDEDSYEGFDNTHFYKTTTPEEDELNLELHRVWLSLSAANKKSNMMLGYTNLSSDEKDGMDGLYYNPTQTLKLYTTKQEDLFAIQTYALPFEDTDVFTVGYQAAEAGTYTIKLEAQDGLFDNQDVYLKDKEANVLHNLKDGVYEFLSTNGTFEDRFQVVFRSELSVDPVAEQQANFIVYTKDGNVNLQTAGFDIKDVYIYDIVGRKLYSKQNVNAEAHQATILGANQVLVVKIVTPEGVTLVKKVQQ
ncbi:MAG: hypothetical protein Q4B43_01285 [Bacteroidota bacterium]|nr:hypothetical protein [Bacteroidota bacterium]